MLCNLNVITSSCSMNPAAVQRFSLWVFGIYEKVFLVGNVVHYRLYRIANSLELTDLDIWSTWEEP